MATTSTPLLDELLEMIGRLAEDWGYDEPLSADTRLFGDLGLESLDLVVLGTVIQERYGRVPFAEFLADMGKHGARDVTLGDLVIFVDEHRAAALS